MLASACSVITEIYLDFSNSKIINLLINFLSSLQHLARHIDTTNDFGIKNEVEQKAELQCFKAKK